MAHIVPARASAGAMEGVAELREPGERAAEAVARRNAGGIGSDRVRTSVGLEQLGELLDHCAGELVGIHDRHRSAVITGHVVADADRDQLDR